MEFMEFLDLLGLGTFLDYLKTIFGFKKNVDECADVRELYLLNIDYENTLAFDVNQIVGENSPYVGSATVGSTYVA